MELPLRILFVEDKPEEAELVIIALRRDGLTVVWERIETASELRAALAAGPWDAVLADYTLPVFDCKASLAVVRAADADLPFIVVSGTVGEDVAVRMMLAGANDYVFKHTLTRLAPALVREIREAENRRARKQADKAMRASETRYRRLFEAARDGILLVDVASWCIFDANPFLANLLGYERAELIGKELWELGFFHDAEANKAAFRTLQDQGYIRYDDLPLATKGGRLIEVEFVSNIYEAGDDRVIQCNIRDVTEKKRADEALRAGEERLRLFVENVSAPVAMLDREMRYLHVSRRWMTDYRLGERPIIGLSHYEVFPSLPQSWKDIHQRCLAGVIDRCDEAQLEHADGVVQWIRWEVRPWALSGGEIGGIIMFTEDITARKGSEDAMRSSEQRYRTLVAATAAIVWTVSASGVVEGELPQWSAFTGQATAEVQGWGWLAAIHPDDRENTAQHWTTATTAGSTYEVEHRLRRADGEYRYMSARGVPIFDSAGVILEWFGVHIDVTTRKRAEALLVESQERLTLATESAGIGIWDWDVAANQMVWDSRMFDFYGVREREFTGEYDAWQRGLHPDDRSRAEAEIATALTGKKDFHTEFRVVQPDGDVRHIEGHAVVQWAGDGSPRRMIGVNWDITDRKRVEFERAELLARLTLQIDRMPLAYMLNDADFRFTAWNPAAERIFGFTAAEVLGKHPFDVIIPPRSQPAVATLFARLTAGDMDANALGENVTKSGRAIMCQWNNTPLFAPDGSFQGILSLAKDVTERKLAEETLNLRDRAIQAATQGLMITDSGQPDNPIMYVSPGFERITGYASHEVLGRNCRFLQGVDTAPAAVAQLHQAIQAEQPFTVELLNYRKDGAPFWNELSIAPVRDATGQLTHFVGVQADVTARRNLEEQLRQAQKMDAFGQLAGGVAHDFNNLLTIINGYSDMLLLSLPAGDSSRPLIAEILKAGERSAKLTQQLLAFSRQQILATRVLNLNEVVTEIDKMLRRLIGEDIRLTTTLDSALWSVQADPGQVEQVLLNLAVNARDAMPEGGRLTIETRNVASNETYVQTHVDSHSGPHVLLSVTDTGGGMSPEVQSRIFEPFFTTKGVGKGTGLGLATVFGIIKQSGGHVEVYSEVGVGTSFKVYLPSLERQSERMNASRRIPTPPRGTETVLLAEDETGVRNLTSFVLAGCGYTVLEAATGDEAIRIADGYDGPIHLLITDVVMPGAGGRAVSERVAGRYPDARVLFISGYTDDAVIRHGVLREGVNFLQKPFSPAALALKVRKILDAE